MQKEKQNQSVPSRGDKLPQFRGGGEGPWVVG